LSSLYISLDWNIRVCITVRSGLRVWQPIPNWSSGGIILFSKALPTIAPISCEAI
jgi:hypothetical protein